MDEASGPPVEVWPDNVTTIDVFMAMQTQWRSSGFGATGLDYTALPAVREGLCLSSMLAEDWSDIFDGLRVMEYKALEVMGSRK